MTGGVGGPRGGQNVLLGEKAGPGSGFSGDSFLDSSQTTWVGGGSWERTPNSDFRTQAGSFRELEASAGDQSSPARSGVTSQASLAARSLSLCGLVSRAGLSLGELLSRH